MKRPAIFFDRDNTLIVSDGYLGDPEKVQLMDGAADAVARGRSLGFATVVISNQSGVARGMFTEADVEAVNRKVDQLLQQASSAAVIDRHEFCPYHPQGTVEEYKHDSERRKPKPGMILEAARKLAIDLPRSWVIGDAPRDIEAGKAAGCRTILLIPPDIAQSPAATEGLSTPPDTAVKTLKEAIDYIQAHSDPSDDQPDAASAEPRPQAGDSIHLPADPPPSRLERLAEQILEELRKPPEHEQYSDFSVSKLMAGIVQVVTLAMLLLSYLNRGTEAFFGYILTAIFMETLTIGLLIMGKQR